MSAVRDIPSEEILIWGSARSLREACSKKMDHIEHGDHWEGKADLVADEVRECLLSDNDLIDTDDDVTLNTLQMWVLANSHITLKHLISLLQLYVNRSMVSASLHLLQIWNSYRMNPQSFWISPLHHSCHTSTHSTDITQHQHQAHS